MKKKWFRTMDLVDDAYILEADPGQSVKSLHKKRIVASVLASAACLALVLSSFWLLKPYSTTPPAGGENAGNAYSTPDGSTPPAGGENAGNAYSTPDGSTPPAGGEDTKNPYYSLILRLREYIGGNSRNEGAASGNFYNGQTASPESALGGVTDGSSGSTYQEVTDNQVEGITEADRIKRSNTHIYYLDGNTLRVFSIAGLASEELGSFALLQGENPGYQDMWEFYLSEDCKTVTVIANRYEQNQKQVCVDIISLDVSNPANITEKNRVEIVGNYLSSRITEGKLLLLTEYVFDMFSIDFDEERTFLPQINGKSVTPEDICLPETVNSPRYTMVTKLDENTLAMEGTVAYLSYSEDVYVSEDHIFLTHVYVDKQEAEGHTVRNSMTEISCLSYKDSFEKKGTAVVRGYVKDQWSMDEYEGVLRVVTTTNATTLREYATGDSVVSGGTSVEILSTATGNSNASLYCIDLQSFETVAKAEDFAPPGEKVQSVRFDKTAAYVCTSIEMSDPVFFFDLSDLANITYKDTGTIEGFSTSLVNFGNGYLLGIGQENWSTFKAEIYQETAEGVEGFCQYTLEDAYYSRDYKAYYIDRENQLLGLGITQWIQGKGEYTSYLLLHFDGYQLVELLKAELPGDMNDLGWIRGVYVDGFMYMFGKEAFKVEQVF